MGKLITTDYLLIKDGFPIIGIALLGFELRIMFKDGCLIFQGMLPRVI